MTPIHHQSWRIRNLNPFFWIKQVAKERKCKEEFTPLHSHRNFPTQELELLIIRNSSSSHEAIKANICFSKNPVFLSEPQHLWYKIRAEICICYSKKTKIQQNFLIY